MKTKGVHSSKRSTLWAVALAAVMAVGSPAFAQHSHGGGGGGGGFHGGGGGSFHGGGGGGGFHGGGHMAGGHIGGGFSGYRPGVAGYAGGFGGHPAGFVGSRTAFAGSRAFVGGAHYSPHVGYASGFRGGVGAHAAGYSGRQAYAGHAGYGYGWGRGGFGWHRPYWGGGYWHGGYWPRAYYGWSYPWFLGVLPAVYATYWWGGIPYYYANDVYYTWNPGYSGYVVTDPPPTDTGDSDSQSGNGTYDAAEPGDVQSNGYSGGSSNVYAYPKDGQSEEQQSTDRYECHKWAVAQSGFDPTQTSRATGNSTDYRRAMAACLDGRGYSAK